MECSFCGEHISEMDWKQQTGKYIAKFPDRRRKRSFHLNELASPWKHWEEIIRDFQEANKELKENGDINKMKTFINTSLGETWEERGKSADDDSLLSRRERYEAEIPDGVLLLTAGVDVQDDRFEVEITGMGAAAMSHGGSGMKRSSATWKKTKPGIAWKNTLTGNCTSQAERPFFWRVLALIPAAISQHSVING